jgi:thiamine biosynthesis lipoprotein
MCVKLHFWFARIPEAIMSRYGNALVLPGLLLVALLQAGESPALVRFSFTEPHMGTRFKILLYAADEPAAAKAAKAAFARVAHLDQVMSDYRNTSELMQLCKQAGGDPVKVSEELFFVLARAQEVSRQSDGAFDVTVGPIVKLWRRAKRTGMIPDKDDLDKALALVGYEKMKLDPKARTVQLMKAGMQLDLGGIAKGYAADEALRVLKEQGVSRALVAAGGDIAASDAPPDAEGWKVGIAPLDDPEKPAEHYVLLKNSAVSTSGDAEQHVVIDGKRYSHIVDPKTGIGLTQRMNVSVTAPNGITSDSLTKVVSVLGPAKGFPIIEATPGVASLVVRKTDKGEETLTSKGFKEYRAPK